MIDKNIVETNKLLTVIIPTYNMEKYLRRCLDSLIVGDETMKYLEILIINDGSKDSSSVIAHDYEKKYPCSFRVIDKENGNYGSCINRGLKEATGKYVKILDADDYFNNKELSSFISEIKDIDADLILTNYAIVDENGLEMSLHKYNLPSSVYLKRKCIDHSETFYNMQMHGITYSRKIFLDNNYNQTEGISYTDQEWIFTPMYQVDSVCYIDKKIYCYLLGREGQTMDPQIMARNISHTVLGLYKMIDDFGKMVFTDNSEKQYFKYRLCQRMRYIYINYLIKNNKLFTNSDIVQIDNNIHNKNIEIYNWGNSIPLFKDFIYFIKIWRKKPNSLRLCLLRQILKWISSTPFEYVNRKL